MEEKERQPWFEILEELRRKMGTMRTDEIMVAHTFFVKKMGELHCNQIMKKQSDVSFNSADLSSSGWIHWCFWDGYLDWSGLRLFGYLCEFFAKEKFEEILNEIFKRALVLDENDEFLHSKISKKQKTEIDEWILGQSSFQQTNPDEQTLNMFAKFALREILEFSEKYQYPMGNFKKRKEIEKW